MKAVQNTGQEAYLRKHKSNQICQWNQIKIVTSIFQRNKNRMEKAKNEMILLTFVSHKNIITFRVSAAIRIE